MKNNKNNNYRDVLGNFLLQVVSKNKKIIHLSPDGSIIGDGVKKIPGQHFDVGIAEQNIVGVAAGLALKGKIVVINSIASFITANAYMQLRNLVCYHNLNIIIFGVGSGLSYGALGFSHHSNEDIALMSSLPNMKIYLPADVYESKAALLDSIKRGGPAYIRLAINTGSVLCDKSVKINFNMPKVLRRGKEILILTNGLFVSKGLEIVDRLMDHNIYVGLVNVNSVNVFDKKYLKKIINKYKIIFTIEEHYVDSGFGSCMQNIFDDKKIIKIGLPKEFCGFSGSRDELLAYYGLSSEAIIKQIIKYGKSDTKK